MHAGFSQVCDILGFLASLERRQQARDGCWDMPKASSAPAASDAANYWVNRRMRVKAVELPGEPAPADQVTEFKDAAAASLRARWWARRVAWEVAQTAPEGEREAVEYFVLRHRVSIIAAFHMKPKRSDVVAEMTRLWSAKADCSP
jgi:hypothetical protein